MTEKVLTGTSLDTNKQIKVCVKMVIVQCMFKRSCVSGQEFGPCI